MWEKRETHEIMGVPLDGPMRFMLDGRIIGCPAVPINEVD